MPHFIIDCSENVLELITPADLMQLVYEVAEQSDLFAKNDIKVRINSFTHYQLAPGKENFLHLFGYIMEGRTVEQRAALSKAMISRLAALLPRLSVLSMNIQEFELATYCNKAMLHADNPGGDRHFGL
ncbi:MAG: 5-carboxymethyl-2-hydroxymuconate Delta-isomerase [Ferruginibacter sp.]